MERRSQKQSALTQLAKKGILTTNPTSTHRALASLSPNIQSSNQLTKKAAGRRKHRRNKKTHKKNRKSYF